ncbi:MAG TPA: hypothetical protein ENJ08_06125 [Gammaproteobacteria bacterium]|nr:hypothetical protein [Gammaproteobacteria bacterium]
MKQFVIILTGLLFALSAQAQELTQKNLQGSWRTVKYLGLPYNADDGWDIEGNIYYDVIDGHRGVSATFKIKGNKIITDDGDDTSEEFDIVILEFTGDTIKVKSGSNGYESILKKKKGRKSTKK